MRILHDASNLRFIKACGRSVMSEFSGDNVSGDNVFPGMILPGRVALGDCSPRAPTDPYVRD